MIDRDLVLAVIQRVLMEIREAAATERGIDGRVQEKIFLLSDLVHNAPVALSMDGYDGGDGRGVLAMIRDRAEDKGIAQWLDNALADVRRRPESDEHMRTE